MENLGYNINLCAKLLRSRLNKVLEKEGITSPQFAVIKDIEINSKVQEEVTAVKIASRLGMDKPTISGIINRLIDKGLVEKRTHSKDSRSLVLILTKKCYIKLSKFEEENKNVLSKATEGLKENEKLVLNRLLNKVIDNLKEGN